MNYNIENPPKPITNQWIFNIVSNHLLSQNKKAAVQRSDNSISHRYRTTDGLKCAIGCLIPDKLYNPIIECFSLPIQQGNISEGSVKLVEIFKQLGYNESHFALMKEMQTIHDCYDPQYWKIKLTHCANFHKFTINFPEEHRQS